MESVIRKTVVRVETRVGLGWLVDSKSASSSSSLGKSWDREASNGVDSVGSGWVVALDLPLPLSNALELDSTGTGADAGSATGIGELIKAHETLTLF